MTGAMCAIGVLAGSAAARPQLPEATGKAETIRLCGTCHDPLRAASVRLTREGWQDVIAKMVTLGMKGTDEELTRVLEYLAEHFKGDAPRPLNLNTATSVELESVAGLLRSESAAWIAHRTKAGPCASLDDFRKVPGVPFKKIDDRRDRLVCFAAVTVPPPAQGGGPPQTPRRSRSGRRGSSRAAAAVERSPPRSRRSSGRLPRPRSSRRARATTTPTAASAMARISEAAIRAGPTFSGRRSRSRTSMASRSARSS